MLFEVLIILGEKKLRTDAGDKIQFVKYKTDFRPIFSAAQSDSADIRHAPTLFPQISTKVHSESNDFKFKLWRNTRAAWSPEFFETQWKILSLLFHALVLLLEMR